MSIPTTPGPQRPRLQQQTDDDPAWLGAAAPRLQPKDSHWEHPVAAAGLSKTTLYAIGAAAFLAVAIVIAVVIGGEGDAASVASPLDAGVTPSGLDAQATGGDAKSAAAAKAAAKAKAEAEAKAAKAEALARARAEADAKKSAAKEQDTKPDKKPDSKPDKKPDREPDTKSGKVTLTILVVPPSATILVGAKRVHGSITVDKSDTSLPVKISAPGYQSKTANVTPNKDRELVFQLLREPELKEPDEATPDPPKPDKEPLDEAAPEPTPEPAPKPTPEPTPEPPASSDEP